MTAAIDLRPAAERLAAVVTAVPDSALDAPTPVDASVSGLLAHVEGLSIAFTAAAAKAFGVATESAAAMTAPLGEGWRERIPAQVRALAGAWRLPSAWEGDTQAGGVTMPAPEAGVVALDELVLHSWDLAVATGQTVEHDAPTRAAVLGFLEAVPDDPAARAGLFGPRLEVPEGADEWERILRLAGRDPSWTGARPPGGDAGRPPTTTVAS